MGNGGLKWKKETVTAWKKLRTMGILSLKKWFGELKQKQLS